MRTAERVETDRIPLALMDNADPELLAELVDTVARVAGSGQLVGGPAVAAFEDEFARYCGVTEAVGVSSGTDALVFGLRALGVRAGEEVIVPANSFIATAEAVSLAGGVPRFADVDPVTHVVTAETVERCLGPRTRHVIVVHLYGRTVDFGSIRELAEGNGLTLIEDACQAHGARYHDRRVGSLGVFGAFSFYPAKNLGAWGDAGALTTCDRDLAERVRLLRSHGEKPRYYHRVVGTTGRLDAIQAAILRVKLARLDSVNDARRRSARRLADALAEVEVVLPAMPPPGQDHVYHQFVVEHAARDPLRAHLALHGIETGIHYPIPIHRSHAYRALSNGKDPAPVATRLADRICSLPLHPDMTASTAERIAELIADWARD